MDGTIRGASKDLQRGRRERIYISWRHDHTYILAKSGAEGHTMDRTCNVVSGERNYALKIIITIMACELGHGPLGKGHHILPQFALLNFWASIYRNAMNMELRSMGDISVRHINTRLDRGAESPHTNLHIRMPFIHIKLIKFIPT